MNSTFCGLIIRWCPVRLRGGLPIKSTTWPSRFGWALLYLDSRAGFLGHAVAGASIRARRSIIIGLMEAAKSKGRNAVKFVACDIPKANGRTIRIMAAFAEHEVKRISERTKERTKGSYGPWRSSRRGRFCQSRSVGTICLNYCPPKFPTVAIKVAPQVVLCPS